MPRVREICQVTPPPLAIVQARIGSTRLPGKMLLDLGGHPLIWWAWTASIVAFGPSNVVIAIPATPENDELAKVCDDMGATVFRWDGSENDVLGRFHACAHTYRWHPDSVIVRVTPDDPFKVPLMMHEVANGARYPVEWGAEAFTLTTLNQWHFRAGPCEHLTGLMRYAPPKCPPGVWTIDTQADLDAARKILAEAGGPLPNWLTKPGAQA